jgi:drug/metabolite transporter (DMT)-like permease
MKKFFFLGFGLLMAFDTLAQICFKFTANNALPLELSSDWLARVLLHPWIYGSIIGYIGTYFTWLTLLKRLSIGASFAASHMEVVSVMLVSVWLFNEPMTWPKLSGAVLILAGIFCLAIAEEKLTGTKTA